MAAVLRPTLEDLLDLEYPFRVLADPAIGGYVITFPDLPGCMTHVDRIGQVGKAADEIRRLWIRTEYEDGENIPLPSHPETYSGKFVVRLPRSLHRRLAEDAEREGVSLNQYTVMLLAENNAYKKVEYRIDDIQSELVSLRERIQYQFSDSTDASSGRSYPYLITMPSAVDTAVAV